MPIRRVERKTLTIHKQNKMFLRFITRNRKLKRKRKEKSWMLKAPDNDDFGLRIFVKFHKFCKRNKQNGKWKIFFEQKLRQIQHCDSCMWMCGVRLHHFVHTKVLISSNRWMEHKFLVDTTETLSNWMNKRAKLKWPLKNFSCDF